jgi:hypothetical protein
MRPSVRAAVVAALVTLASSVGSARGAHAADAPAPTPAPTPAPAPTAPPPTLVVPRVDGLVLDGKLSDAGWANAVELPSEAPPPAAAGAKPPPRTTVRLAASGGRLFVGVEVTEPVGFACGVRGFVAPEGTTSLASATGFAYLLQDARGLRYVARGVAGDGRAAYRVVGAMDASQPARWTAELAVPFADLGLPTDTTALKLAVTASRRQPNVLVAAPPGSAFATLDTFATLKAPEGGWAAGAAVELDGKALAAEDTLDKQRIGHWQAFVKLFNEALQTGVGTKDAILAPLDRAIAARPDLAVLHLAKGEVLGKLGDPAGAKQAFAAGLALVPTMPEAQWSLAQLEIGEWIEPADTEPSDYAGTFAGLAEVRKGRIARRPRDGFAEAVLRYRSGESDKAVPLFDAVLGLPRRRRQRRDGGPRRGGTRRRSRRSCRSAATSRRAAAGPPRERRRASSSWSSFEDDAPNTVANFVWLADAKFYDGTVFHRVVPFFMAQGGDPFSATPTTCGVGGRPGYAIPTEANRRRPFRGVIAMAHACRDDEGASSSHHRHVGPPRGRLLGVRADRGGPGRRRTARPRRPADQGRGRRAPRPPVPADDGGGAAGPGAEGRRPGAEAPDARAEVTGARRPGGPAPRAALTCPPLGAINRPSRDLERCPRSPSARGGRARRVLHRP